MNKDEKEKLKKIGVKSILDLALLFPKSFEDLSVSNYPNDGENTVEIECGSSFFNRSILNINAYCLTWQMDIKISIFNAKPWHYNTFKSGKRMFIHGKASKFANTWQFINPKVVTKIGYILPKYKLSLRDGTVQGLILKYLNLESLLKEGLNEDEANLLLSMHKNDKSSINLITNLEQNHATLNTLKFVEIFNYLKKLSKKKLVAPAKKIIVNNIEDWLKNLPFKPTSDQIKALEDIKNDFLGNTAKRRVIMGDVGSGKTLVMLGSSLMVYPKVSILMAPTSILAEQIYSEAKRLLPSYLKTILVKSGDKDVDYSGVNLIIGTHVLLYQELPKANLIMVDEQHRFGSNQRDKINSLTKDGDYLSHYLQFSATPIPRTLTLIESELVSFSFLKQIPFKKDIKTIILQSSGFSTLISHMEDEIKKGKQVIVVYPLVEESEVSQYQSLNEGRDYWFKHFENVYLTHGKDKDKEDILNEFKEKGDVLLTTTVVEVGISLPRLSIIVVVAAERMGLATLHQLRGRVGRQGGKGWCYLFTKLKNPPSRLKEFAQTLDGFKVAQIDLKNRQSGDLLDGTVQHGATFKYYNYEEDITIAAKDRLKSMKLH